MQTLDIPNIKIAPLAKAFAIIGCIIFLCCLLGIFTRPLSFLAFFWPANAVMLAFFLRFPQLNNAGGWIGAFSGYMLADLVTGNHLELTFFLTLANLINTAVSLFLIHFFYINYRNYNKGFTFLHLFAICSFGGCFASALVAVFTIPYVPNTFMSTGRLWIDFGMWWTGEMVNAILVMPVILAFPTLEKLKYVLKERRSNRFSGQNIFPLIAIIICVSLTYFFSGPGALLYPLAALIWAALTYHLFTVAIINFAVLLVTYHSLNQLYLSESSSAYLSTAISVRIGLCMLSLAPLILCIISQNRHDLYKQVLYLANHDSLTGVMNRRYFFQKSEEIINDEKNYPFSIVMIDIDHFKNLNDAYGHYAGDLVLQQFVKTVTENLRDDDLFARMGGEEFIIFLKSVNYDDANRIAERIRNVVEQTPMPINHSTKVHITVSMGITHQNTANEKNLQTLINQADQALYQAKQQGRNQIIMQS